MHGVPPDDLVSSHMWIVERFAAAYYCFAPTADLKAAGTLGLVEAARRYKRKRGTAFSTYAWNWVKGNVFREMRLNHVVPVPEHMARRACKEGEPIRGVVRFGGAIVPVEGDQEPSSERAMRMRTLHYAIEALDNPDHRHVINRTLAGRSVAQIAKGMKVTHKRVEELMSEAQAILAREVE